MQKIFKPLIIVFCIPLILVGLFALEGLDGEPDYVYAAVFLGPAIFLLIIAFWPVGKS